MAGAVAFTFEIVNNESELDLWPAYEVHPSELVVYWERSF